MTANAPDAFDSRRFDSWQLRPVPSIRFLGSGQWLAQDDDPQFSVCPLNGRIRPGFYEIRVDCQSISEFPLTPRIYFDRGKGFDEAAAVQLPTLATRFERILWIPPGTFRVRLDPIAQAGRFALDDIAFRRLSLADLLTHVSVKSVGRKRVLSSLLKRGPLATVGMIEANARDEFAGQYELWLNRYEPDARSAGPRIKAHISALPIKPLFSIVMPAYNSNPDWLRQAIDSVRRQDYGLWELCIVDDASATTEHWDVVEEAAKLDTRIKPQRMSVNGGIAAATNAALQLARGDWIAFMDHDDVIRHDALALIADRIATNEAARIIYTDEDKIDETGRRYEPYMKGAWNRELFYSQNMLNHLTVVRRDVINAAGPLRAAFDGSQDYDLLLRCIEHVDDDAIVHVPFVCYHWRFATQRVNFSHTQGARAFENAIRALQEHFDRTKTAATAERAVPDASYTRARWRLEPVPLVSLIIPTRDRKPILETAIRSIVERTTYKNFEILIVDNDSKERATLDYFATLERNKVARIVRAPGDFNFSRINNIAAREAKGSILGFVNNDVEVRNREWLEEIVSHFARPDVGAVGAKLYFGDGRIQHAGVVTGIGGVAGHLYKLFPGNAPGPFSLLRLPREVTAATGACLMVRAELFNEIGGFNEDELAVAFNDVDLCLRIRKRGPRIVWTPFAELTHFESVSRGADTDPAKQQRFQREVRSIIGMWGQDVLDDDRYYSPNLTLKEENGALALPPRVKRPWD